MEVCMQSPQKPVLKISSSECEAGSGDASNSLSSSEGGQGTQELAMHQVHTIMHELEQKREADKQMTAEFRQKMTDLVEQTCDKLEQHLMSQYEETNKQLEVKMQYLYSILGSVCALEGEMTDFKAAISVLFKDITTKT